MSVPQPSARRPHRSSSKRSKQPRPPASAVDRGRVAEIAAKLLINGVISAAAITAILKLLPYHLSQQAKLREIRGEVALVEQRVEALRNNFGRNFDPQQAETSMKEYSPRITPNRYRVFWLPPQE